MTITPSIGAPRTVETDAPGFVYAAADRAADGASGAGAIDIEICQLGTWASSEPASATFTL